jgi:poly-gamma-glutamate capsule biosynthesis protein CapA/YwtB (metallophosphatase superfamily)
MTPRRKRVTRWFGLGLLVAGLGFAWLARPMLIEPSGESFGGLPSTRLTAQRPGRASVLLVGDTHFGESYGTPITDYDAPLAGVRALAKSADFLVVNLETPLTHITDSPLRRVKHWVHWGHPEHTVRALRGLGVHAVSLANNHAFDALGPGLTDTQAALSAEGVLGFGTGSTLAEAAQPFRVEVTLGQRSLKLVVIGALQRTWRDWLMGAYASSTGPGTYPLAARTLTSQLGALRQADPSAFVVVFPHWGNNYAWHSPAQSELGRRLIDAGADLVLGHGAHLFQEIEPYRGSLILHGLGNFVFLSPGRYADRGMHGYSLAARLDFSEQGAGLNVALALYFLASDNQLTQYRPYVLGGEEFERVERILLDGGTLAPEARSELKRRVSRQRDEVGEYLFIQLGTPPVAIGDTPPLPPKRTDTPPTP